VVERLKQIVLLVFAFLFLLSTCLHVEIPVSAQTVNNPYELVVATIGEPETVDPAECYDTASAELISNVYDTLIRFDGESVAEFVPCLATEWDYDEDTYTYTFTIREGVSWTDRTYGTVTPEDVEYSFERWMVQDIDGGPTWMIFEPLLGTYTHDIEDPEFINKIDAAVESDDTNVYLHLVGPYPQMIVYQVFAQQWASVLCKEWAIEQGCWDGVYTHESAQMYYNPEVSRLMDPEPVMMGTGPYMLDYWERDIELAIYRNDDYWGGWPAEGYRGWVERVTKKFIDDWDTRKVMFLAGDLDITGVPRTHIEDVWGEPGVRCVYPLPALSCSGFFFSFDVQPTSRYLRPPYTSYECAPGELNEGGFPPDFFTDIHVRKGFAYCMNYTEFLAIAYFGEAVYPATPAIQGLPYRRSDEWYAEHQYMLDLAKAEEEFKLAWGGELWETGFTLPLSYDTGNLPRKTIAKMLKANIESLNPKFHVCILEVECDILPDILSGEVTAFFIGWLADYPDPHNFFHPFMYSHGAYADWQFYSNPAADALIEEGGTCTDPARREEIYFELQEMYINECPSVCAYQAAGRHWERTWVQGWYYNPARPGIYFYHLWKEDLPMEDLNQDGTVNIRDLFRVAKAFGSYYKVGDVHPRWYSYSDINQDTNVNILDIGAIASKFGSQTLPWQPP